MKKIIKNTIISALLLITVNAFASGYQYEPEQLKQYQETGKCEGCILGGANISYLGSVDLKNAILTRVTVDGFAQMRNSDFSGAIATESNWTSSEQTTDLSGSKFVNTILEDDIFYGDNLTDVDFTGANMKDASVAGANLTGAKLTQDQIQQLHSDCGAIMPDGITRGTICP